MNFRRILGTQDDGSSYLGWYVDWIEEWSQLLSWNDNWYTFHPMQIEFEWDRILGGAEITIIILGLGFRVRWNYAETKTVLDLKNKVDELIERHDA